MDSRVGVHSGGTREAHWYRQRALHVTQSAMARMWLLQVPGRQLPRNQGEAEYDMKDVADVSGGMWHTSCLLGKSRKYCGCEEGEGGLCAGS